MNQGFVGRDAELKQLNLILQKALKGETQVCFITGEAGAGKSRLIEEFVKQSENLDNKLLFAKAQCNDQFGFSDSYAPFRSILATLLGDSADAITSQNKERLAGALKWVGRAVVEVSPELVGTLLPLIPGGALLTALGKIVGKEQGWFNHLESRAKAAEKNPSDIEQSQVFQQYTALLRDLSKEYPLVIILDDLQWVDPASNALLFHLARELKTSRILFVGLYRPNDVAAGRNHERHPLEITLNETKRIYGDVRIDLDETAQQSGCTFVNALLDSQPNTLSPAFRAHLFERTKGHVLFTIELLRAMQERGDLIQTADGRWQESSQLDWDTLPGKVEAIIEERIERLEKDLRDILEVACVEGQEFTAQVVAKIQEIKERELIKTLSRDLERCHRLVQDVGDIKLGKTRLYRYAFSHALFQVYLYNTLEIPEREMYHADVANALEELYAGHTEAIAVQLAYHYTAAGEPKNAVPYLQQAGEQDCKLGEFVSARNFFTQALTTIEAEGTGHPDIQHAQILWWIGQTYYHTGKWGIAETYYRQSLEMARQVGDKELIAQALIDLAQSLRRQLLKEDALTIAQEALNLTRQTGNRSQESAALRVLGIAYGQMDRNDERLACYEGALKIAVDIGAIIRQMACLNNLGVVYGGTFGNYPKGIEYANQALSLGQQHHSLTGQVTYLENLADFHFRLGNYEKAKGFIDEHLKLTSQMGDIQSTSIYYECLGDLLLHQGDASSAIEQWLESIQRAGDRIETQVTSRNRLLIGYLVTDQLEQAEHLVQDGKPFFKKFASKIRVCSEVFLEALLRLRMGHMENARRLFELAKDHATQSLHSKRWTYRYHRAFAQAGTALLAASDRQSDYLSQTSEWFKDAVDNCGWAGTLTEVLIVLREMRKADPEGLLQPIEEYLVEKREIAWKNRPFND